MGHPQGLHPLAQREEGGELLGGVGLFEKFVGIDNSVLYICIHVYIYIYIYRNNTAFVIYVLCDNEVID
jgi:hypothetical protein